MSDLPATPNEGTSLKQFYETACAKGGLRLKRAEKDDSATPTTLTLANCQYNIQEGWFRPNQIAWVSMKVAAVGLNIRNVYWIDITSPGREVLAYSNWFDVEHGIIICNENYKVEDTNPEDRKLFASEIIWQC